MTSPFTVLVFICLILRTFVHAFETASFYGGSYIGIPLQDAKSTTDIHLRFRTKQPDAFLFLAAGKTDYCLLKLQSGKLKVHINLGAGESELSSPKGLRLDDLTWHEVILSRKDAEVKVTIDKIHNVREKLPGKYFELNIYDGLFLGGSGDSLDLFLGHFDWLRGCLSAVVYNGVDVLKRARYRAFQSDVHDVTWSCASEFDASFNSDMSFMEDGAFMSLPNPVSRIGVRWQFELKTNTEDCMLFYNSKLVQGGRNDYVGLEIVNRKLRLAMDTGGGVTEVWNEATITDGEWHLVTVQISTNTLEVVVDGKFVGSTHVTIKTGNKYLDLADIVYIGGLELNKRANALAVGMRSADKSFKGCLRSMEADGKLLGFPNAKVTQGVLPNCVWSYACSSNPCSGGASCSQYGVDSFHCECDRPPCSSSDNSTKVKPFTKSSLPIALEILSLNPVQVMEGDTIPVSTDNVNVILDYAKYGIRDSGVSFRVTQPPHHGSINIGSGNIASGHIDSHTVFTLLDLSNEKVHYVHDGSENCNDSFILDLEFTTSVGHVLPSYLEGRNLFVVSVDVAPVNDPPFLFIPSAKVFRLAEGTRKVITADLLNASDSDNSNSELLYSVLNQSNNSYGYVARLEAPNAPITSFTQEDIDQRKIIYVHNGNSGEDKIALQVSDGMLSSALSFLRLSVFVLELHQVNNTGITLAQKSSALITHNNLAFETNAEDPLLHIKYDIIEFPKYGEIQCLMRSKNDKESWQRVTWFTDQYILREAVRYVHTEETSSAFDTFKFKVRAKSLELSTIYEFRATFVQLKLRIAANESVTLSESQTAVIKESNLKVVTEPLQTNVSSVVFTLLRAPKVSDLVLSDRIIKRNGTWTQKHIADGKLAFHLHKKTFSDMDDHIVFSVSAAQCEPIDKLILRFKYRASEEQKNAVRVVVSAVQVPEGKTQLLLPEHLELLKGNLNPFYKILDGPNHGWLNMYDIDHTRIEERNVTQFANMDIVKKKVTYTHDDSESSTDAIQFVVYGQHGEDFQFVVTLMFEISLRNDNPPYCVVNNGLNVVIGGDKIITREDLLYEDADIDAKPESISYTPPQIIPNGAFLLSDSPHSQLRVFSQSDINNRRVMFRHNGPLTTNITMLVSDGDTHFEFGFNIVASAPYVKVTNNSKLLLRQGGQIAFTASNLRSSTNINVTPQTIKYTVMKSPEVGQLELAGKSTPVKTFTQEDVERNQLLYRHTGVLESVKDRFLFQVSVHDIYVEDEFHIRLFPAVYWEPLVLENNRTLFVEEDTEVQITHEDLVVHQALVPPSDITYFVVEAPKYGYLDIEVNGRYIESKDTPLTLFDQGTVDDGKLYYIHLTPNRSYDHVVLDATNGIAWLRNIIVSFVIIPEQIYISAEELHVEEGGFTRLNTSLLTVCSPYYADRISEYKVRKFPQHGSLQLIGSPSKSANVSHWTTAQLFNKQIQYIHDGSETAYDSMTLVAYDGSKESVPTKVNILISPVNDEVPKIVNNTGASAWRGGICRINSSNLATIDQDTSAANITYVIVSAQAGYVAYTHNLNTSVDNFTQSDIDGGRIVFVHSGEKVDGEFDTVVNDGEHRTDPVTFRVKILLPVLNLVKRDFQIFPMLRKAITASHLLTWCSDTSKNIFYVIKTPPEYGVLTTADSDVSVSISNFSQADVNASRIWYQHTSHIVDADTSHDSFKFDVIADYATPIQNQMLSIKIAVSSGGLDSKLDVEKYEVEEGGVVNLFVNTSKLISFLSSDTIGLRYPSVRAIIAEFPKHGSLCVGDDCSLTQLTNEQMNTGVLYKHDHSDSRFDNLTLTLFLEQDNITLCNVTMRIVVHPINDQPFKLAQDKPYLSVVQGEKFVLTPDQLLTTDKDSYPDEIVYDVVDEPSIGALYINGTQRAGKFTQADINAGRIVYEHKGPVQSTFFHFRVSDGRFTPAYGVFNIFVLAAKLNVTILRSIPLLQGTNNTVVPATIFGVQTNHRANDILYSVTTSPRFGYVLVNNVRNTTFTQNDLKAKRVIYMQSDMSADADAFEVEASLSSADSRVRNIWLNVSVEPLIKIGHFNPSSGSENLIHEEVLNASQLARKTSLSPVFEVIKPPKHGKLQIIKHRKRNERKAGKDVDKFTYDNISSKIVYYVANKVSASVEDGFEFRLVALSVQPARGEIKFQVNVDTTTTRATIRVRPSSPSRGKTTAKPTLPMSVDGEVIASPKMTPDGYYLLVSLLSGLVVVSLLFVILMRCRSKKRAEEDMKMNPPLPLPRPPDDLLPSSPYPKRNMLHSTPQCKVIPLGSDSMTSSEHDDFNLRYPYGVADEDWSSCDTNGYPTRANNPMLRKNQYWV